MFKAVELGRKVDKQEFRERVPELRVELLDLQRRIRDAGIPVVVLVSGVEGAGKGDVIHRLSEWLDPRGIETHAFWDETDDERDRPYYWRFWRRLPAKGTIGFMFGSWYTRPIIDRVFRRRRKSEFERELVRIRQFEKLLTDDGMCVVKLWFHLSMADQQRALESDIDAGRQSDRLLRRFAKRYKRFAAVSQRAIQFTDTGQARWHLIESHDAHYRDLATGLLLRESLQQALAASTATPGETEADPLDVIGTGETVLDRVDLTASVTADSYPQRLTRAQERLSALTWHAHRKRINSAAMFEGWDAAGKGGAIRRITQALDPRLYRVISVASPTDEERAHHYLWRFWRHVPRGGYVTLYDRSWYGRVLVERVEGFAAPNQWRRAYREINEFEEHLTDHGMVLLKFWLHLSPDEQLARFHKRENTPWKMYKITDDDWRNRERWGDYAEAVHEMVTRTTTPHCPWQLVAANDKKHARLTVLDAMADALEARLDGA